VEAAWGVLNSRPELLKEKIPERTREVVVEMDVEETTETINRLTGSRHSERDVERSMKKYVKHSLEYTWGAVANIVKETSDNLPRHFGTEQPWRTGLDDDEEEESKSEFGYRYARFGAGLEICTINNNDFKKELKSVLRKGDNTDDVDTMYAIKKHVIDWAKKNMTNQEDIRACVAKLIRELTGLYKFENGIEMIGIVRNYLGTAPDNERRERRVQRMYNALGIMIEDLA